MKRATLRTVHADAAVVAAALAPDNTPEMTTHVELDADPDSDAGGTSIENGWSDADRTSADVRGVVETTIRRETTAGLRSTVDDYVRNLQVAQRVVNERHDTTP